MHMRRRGAALEGLGRLQDALSAYETTLKYDANNAASQQAISALKVKISRENSDQNSEVVKCEAMDTDSVQVKKEDILNGNGGSVSESNVDVKMEDVAVKQEEYADDIKEGESVQEDKPMVCVYVCMYVCMYVCVHVCICECVYVRKFIVLTCIISIN
jgi:hypothetical protein